MKDQSLFNFPVKRESIINSMGQDTGFDSIFRTDSGTSLGVVSRDYQLIKHNKAVTSILNLFEKKKVPIEPVKINVSSNGARLFASFKTKKEIDLGISPKSNKEIGDVISPGFMILNSYDRSIRFSLQTFVFRLVCLNGMTVREQIFSHSKRHTSNLDVEEMIENFMTTFETFDNIVPTISKMAQKKVTPTFLQDELNKVPGWVQDYSIDYLNKSGFINVEEDEGSPVIEMEKDLNHWDLLNAFTYVLTHTKDVSPERRFEATKEISARYWS